MLSRYTDQRPIRSDVQRLGVLQIFHCENLRLRIDIRLPHFNDARLFGARQHRQLLHQTVCRRHIDDVHLLVQFGGYRVQCNVHEMLRFREIQWLSGGCLHSLIHQLIATRIKNHFMASVGIGDRFAPVCGPIVVTAFPRRRTGLLIQKRSVECGTDCRYVECTNGRSANAVPVCVVDEMGNS